MLNAAQIGNELNRSVKLAIDSGEARSIEEAQRIFQGYKLSIVVGPDLAFSATKQAALLTAVNTGRRCFLGGVEVRECPDAELVVPLLNCRSVPEAVVQLGGTLVSKITGLGAIAAMKSAGVYRDSADLQKWGLAEMKFSGVQ